MVYIYILECLKYKYYVGKTNNPKFRLNDHFTGFGCVWTTKYKPIKLLEIFKGDQYDEDKYTLMYMEKYGIDNVRGGSYTQIILPKEQKEQIRLQLNSANDRCKKCGKNGHFAKDCYSSIASKALEFAFDFYDSMLSEEENIVCYRCGRENHYANKCYAKKHIDGYYL
jgi:hypothetical protein